MKYLFQNILALVMIFALQTAHASSYPKVDQIVRSVDDNLVLMKAKFYEELANPQNKSWVKKKLQHMVNVDQYIRGHVNFPKEQGFSEEETKEFWNQFGMRWRVVDTENTDDLKSLLEVYPWFKVSQFGDTVDKNAWLLVQHADHDLAFQRLVLKRLEKLYPDQETNPSNYAYLYDRVAASLHDPSQRTLQRYGTQGQCTGHYKWEALPMEDPEHVDIRRASVGLGPFSEYQEQVRKLCP